MKKKLLTLFIFSALFISSAIFLTKMDSNSEAEKLRQQHLTHLENSPFRETLKLSKAERKAQGIAPNKYMERQYELTMDPTSGKPHPERLFKLQEELSNQFSRVPGENDNGWEERGPDNVGGRTRAIMYDPNDVSGTRVFAAGVSGGLWVIDDITNSSAIWSEVNIPQNLAISCLAYDPNDSSIFYAGTGESHVFNSVNGNGLWQSTNGGVTWTKIFGGSTGNTQFKGNAEVIVNSPGSIAGDYSAILATAFGGQLGSAVTADLELVDDSVDETSDACEAITNGGDLNGKIALIRRGSCNFDDKIKRAQDVGAVAVIMVNNIPGNPIPMGGDDGSITIPSVMVSQEDGELLIATLGSGVNATMQLSGELLSGDIVAGVQHINDIKIRDIGGGNSEVFIAVGSNGFYDSSPRAYLGLEESGLYKSTDEGANFSKISLPTAASGLPLNPNDLEIGIDNTIWMSTTINRFYGDGGGLIFSSTDGTTFTQKFAIPDAQRTQIAVSGSDPDVVYMLAASSGVNALYLAKTENGFTSKNRILFQPQDVDTADRLDGDFAGNQSFFNLLLEVDPTNDNNLYVGGIDLFRSSDGGVTSGNWDQISKWSNNNNLAGLAVSLVHSDQHALTFDPSDPNKGVFGNDGGVYYCGDLVSAIEGSGSATTAIQTRDNNYNTLQFYHGAIGQDAGAEKFLAGAQDNGSLFINNAGSGLNGGTEVSDGDGAYAFIDRDGQYMISSYVYSNFYYLDYTTGNFVYQIDGNDGEGDFINPSDLDSANNILYADGTYDTDPDPNSTVLAYRINRYALGGGSAVKTTLEDGLLVRSATAFKASTFTTTTLFVGTEDGKLFKLENANATPTWSDISSSDFVGSISNIELGATENDIYITFYNYGVASIYYSADGGASWASKEGNLPDIPVRAIMANPLNADEVIIGTELGVWGTKNFNDANPTWSQAQNGMKDVQVTSFDLRTSDNTVLAATYGRGVFTGQFDALDSGLSVDKFTRDDLIKVYPTVSDGNFTIAPASQIREGAIAIFDINGRKVYSSDLEFASSGARRVSLNLSSGLYILKFSSEDLQSTHKIIIE